MKTYYETITGRKLDLSHLNNDERKFLIVVQETYAKEKDWTEFASWWMKGFQRTTLSSDSVVYRLCQDLEARLGIAQGKVAMPDYRDYLADLIEERYGSRYRFCKKTGVVDPGQLSRVLAGRAEFSLEQLQRILAALRATLVVRPQESLYANISPEDACRALTAASGYA